MAKKIAIKIDVDTKRGYDEGVPRMLDVFKQENIKVEINEEFDALKNVEKVKNGNIKDIKVNTKHVKFDKLGKYKVIYTFNDKDYEIPLEVVDTKKSFLDDLNDL